MGEEREREEASEIEEARWLSRLFRRPTTLVMLAAALGAGGGQIDLMSLLGTQSAAAHDGGQLSDLRETLSRVEAMTEMNDRRIDRLEARVDEWVRRHSDEGSLSPPALAVDPLADRSAGG